MVLASWPALGAALLPPAPYGLADARLLEPPVFLAADVCIGSEPDGQNEPSLVAACGTLVRAARELAAGREPEAAALALRAERAATSEAKAPLVRNAARMLRAQALARGGRRAQAMALLDVLAQERPGRLAATAGLERAALLHTAGRPAEARALYAGLLPDRVGGEIVPVASWLRAAEAALASGDPAAARGWLARAAAQLGESADAAVVRLRLADALAQEGAFSEARALLRALAAENASPPVGLLAAARAELMEDSPKAGAARHAALRRAAGSPDREVSGAGSVLLATALLREGAPLEALALLEELLAGSPSPTLAPSVQTALARALDGVSTEARSDAGCLQIVGRLGARLPALARRAGSPAALDAVAACGQRLGLARLAARLRAVREREFGPGKAQAPETTVALEDGPLRAAALYGSGDFGAVREVPAAGAWALLAAAGETAERARAALAATSRRRP
jgi:tetratricopeptide (TPR) repeat protein